MRNFLTRKNPDGSRPLGVKVHRTAKIHKSVILGPDTLVRENAKIESGVVIGPSCFIGPQTSISCKTVIGERVIIDNGAAIDNFVKIGNYSRISCRAYVGHSTVIGSGVLIDDDVVILANSKLASGSKIYIDVPIQLDTSEGQIFNRSTMLAGEMKSHNYCWMIYRDKNNKLRMQIGCQNHSVDEWKKHLKKIARNYTHLSVSDVKAFKAAIDLARYLGI